MFFNDKFSGNYNRRTIKIIIDNVVCLFILLSFRYKFSIISDFLKKESPREKNVFIEAKFVHEK